MKRFIFLFAILFTTTITNAQIKDIGLLNGVKDLEKKKYILYEGVGTGDNNSFRNKLISAINNMTQLYESFKEIYDNGNNLEYINNKLPELTKSVNDLTTEYNDLFEQYSILNNFVKKESPKLSIKKSEGFQSAVQEISISYSSIEYYVPLFNIELSRISNTPYNLNFCERLQSLYKTNRFTLDEYIEKMKGFDSILSDLSANYTQFENCKIKFEDILNSQNGNISKEEIIGSLNGVEESIKQIQISCKILPDEAINTAQSTKNKLQGGMASVIKRTKDAEKIIDVNNVLTRITGVYLISATVLRGIYENN